MVDPIACIGAAASIAGIIDVLSRSIALVSRLTEQWNDSQLAFMSLQTQLQALRGALDQIKTWIDLSEASDIHHQLTMDLDSIIHCCKSLVSRLNSHLETLARDSSGQLRALGKLRLIIGGRNINEIQKMVEKQVGALNLLLAACNWCDILSQLLT
jgi:guanine nucleotide-binding protein G(i) subunit alpha